jgi:hypothetical protein
VRSIVCWGLLALVAIPLAGCRHRDLVEAELRYRNRQVRDLRRQLSQKHAEVHTLQSMMQDGSLPATDGTAAKETPETVYRREAMSRVSLGMSTGVKDVDRNGIDDSVQFTIVCHDYDGDVFKCPGRVDLELAAVQESGVIKPVAHWEMEHERLRATWKASVLSSGYQVIVPMPTLEQSRRWKAIVRFTTLDGRVFQDERTFDYRGGSPNAKPTPSGAAPLPSALPPAPSALPEPTPPAPFTPDALDETVIELPLPGEASLTGPN